MNSRLFAVLFLLEIPTLIELIPPSLQSLINRPSLHIRSSASNFNIPHRVLAMTPLAQKARSVYRRLQKLHSDAKIELNYKTPLELLVATVLSAQCTDVRVNQVTRELFQKYRKPEDYGNSSAKTLEDIIRPTGFFRQKAKNIRAAMKIILEKHAGEVPADMESLTSLPGVGRKTANVILGNAFSIPGLPVDTHVRRVSKRIGLTTHDDPEKIEKDLMLLFPKKDWTQLSHILIFHGRRVCKARKPLCRQCNIKDRCDYFHETQANL